MLLTFLGAAGTVTGSRTLVQPDGDGPAGGGSTALGTLVDCGMFQGPREVRERNWEPFPVDPARIASVVLTHAHLDHCGYLPALVRAGFAGRVHCSPNTVRLAAIVLRDSARLQEEDARYAQRKGFSRHAQPRALYGIEDAEAAIGLMTPVPFRVAFAAAPGITASLAPSGHILGSSVATLVEDATGRTVVFSGDLGRGNHPLLAAPAPPGRATAIVVESTYGDRVHEDVEAALDTMAAAITRTLKRGGTVVIPAFAVDRTEVLLHALRTLQDQQRVPRCPIHVDSPMALSGLRVYTDAIAAGDEEINSATRAEGPAAIDLPNLHEATTPEESKALDRGGARIIVSASGMASGGRVTHHLKALLPDRDNTVVLVGFQATGTPGAMLRDGARELTIHGQSVPVRAEIVDVEAFSVHADAHELVAWLASAEPPGPQVLVNHGEDTAAEALARRIRDELGLGVVVPRQGESVHV